MQQELAFKIIMHTSVVIVVLSLLLLLLIALRKENSGGGPTRGIVFLSSAVLGLCVFMALMAALFGAKKDNVAETISNRLEPSVTRLKQRVSSHLSENISAKGSP